MTIENKVESMCVWMQCNRVILKVVKSSFMIHGNVSLDKPEVSLSISGVNLTKVSRTKFFGIIIDENRKFNDHVNFVIMKLNSATYIIYAAKPYLPKPSMKLLYIHVNRLVRT